MATLEEQGTRIKTALRFWAKQGETLTTIGRRAVDDDKKQKLGELAEIIKRANELIEKL